MNIRERRPLPKGGGISTVHREIRDTVYKFLAEIKRLESELPAEITFEAGPISVDTMKIVNTKLSSQMHSRVVQVFAALAVEAFVNEYGYLRLGEEEFKKHFRRPVPIAKKLTTILSAAFDGDRFEENMEIIEVVKSLAGRRDRLVHPKPEMEVWLEDETVSKTTVRLPSLQPAAANAAVHEMDRFFELFAVIDPAAAFQLNPAFPSQNHESGN